MNRILLEPNELSADATVTLTDRRADHIRDILKPTPGQPLRIGILNGPLGTGIVEVCSPKEVVLRCQLTPTPPHPTTHISLLLALPRPKIQKRLWSPLASLGVKHILLTNADKVERNYFDTHWLNPTHFRPLLIEGLEQAGTTHLPEVTIHRQLKPLIEDHLDPLFPSALQPSPQHQAPSTPHSLPTTLRLLAHPSSPNRIRNLNPNRNPNLPPDTPPSAPSTKHSAPSTPLPTPSALLAIGPEGGWTPYELELLQRHNFTPITTGHETLRSDVACIALLALLREHLAP